MNIKTPIAAAGFTLVATLASAQQADETERPSYDVVSSQGEVELRRYAPRIEARVKVRAESTAAASSAGFTPLANYIFGQNRPGEEIAMTAPVTTAPVSDGGGALTGGEGEKIAMTAPVTTAPSDRAGVYWVSFVMPSEWTMESLPAPQNDEIVIERIAESWIVASGYVGPRSESALQASRDRVLRFIESEGLDPIGPFAVAAYSGPRTPDAQREWEVHRPVKAPE